MSGDEQDKRLGEVIANTAARWAVPVLIAIVGTLLARAVESYADEQRKLRELSERNSTRLSGIESDVRDLNTRLSALVIRRIDEHDKDIERIEARVEAIENSRNGAKP